jgi:hypothetical protein
MKRLAKLAPSLQLVLPSHNVPTAEPSYLPRVLEAAQKVRAGKVKATANDGKKEYVFTGFSFLMSQ